MELEELVVDALAPEEKRNPSPEEIIHDNIIAQPAQIAELAREAREALAKDPSSAWEKISQIVAYNLSSSLSRAGSLNVLFLLHAEKAPRSQDSVDWLTESLQRLEERLRETEQKRRRSSAVGSFTGSLDYLSGLFGEDAAGRIQNLTGAGKPTVKRWLGGGSAQWSNSHKITSFASTLYELIEERGMTSDEVLQWLDAPLASGNSPFELLQQSRWNHPQELREELERLGVT